MATFGPSHMRYDHNPQTLCGTRVIIERPIQVTIRRTWKERFFSLPFRPFTLFRFEWKEILADNECIHDRINNIIYCNERTFIRLKASLEKQP